MHHTPIYAGKMVLVECSARTNAASLHPGLRTLDVTPLYPCLPHAFELGRTGCLNWVSRACSWSCLTCLSPLAGPTAQGADSEPSSAHLRAASHASTASHSHTLRGSRRSRAAKPRAERHTGCTVTQRTSQPSSRGSSRPSGRA